MGIDMGLARLSNLCPRQDDSSYDVCDRSDDIIHRHGFPTATPDSVTDEPELMTELDEIRCRGVAFDGDERAERIRSSPPYLRRQCDLIGAVSVSGPSARTKDDQFPEEIDEMVQGTALVIGFGVSESKSTPGSGS